jgi:hypothetical protein
MSQSLEHTNPPLPAASSLIFSHRLIPAPPRLFAVHQLVGRVHAHLQPDLHDASDWPLVGLPPVPRPHAPGLPLQLVGGHQRTSGERAPKHAFYARPLSLSVLGDCGIRHRDGQAHLLHGPAEPLVGVSAGQL